jgi:hypothetical protein
LRAEVTELDENCDGQGRRGPELGRLAAAFAVAGEKLETVADEETIALLKLFGGNPDIEKARAEFERAQKSKRNSIRISMGKILLSGSLPPLPL